MICTLCALGGILLGMLINAWFSGFSRPEQHVCLLSQSNVPRRSSRSRLDWDGFTVDPKNPQTWPGYAPKAPTAGRN
jgi:hypothetical protein